MIMQKPQTSVWGNKDKNTVASERRFMIIEKLTMTTKYNFLRQAAMALSYGLWYVAAAILLLILPTACSLSDGKDDPDSPDFEEGIPTEVTITLSARSGNAQTRADRDGEDKDPTSAVELIHDWWIAFIDAKGKMTILERKDVPYADRTTSTSVTVGEGFEAETFKIILPSGKYRIYAFANIPLNTEIFKNTDKYTASKGQLRNTYINDFVTDAFTGNVNSANDSMQWRSDKYIPMTQILTEKVISNTVEEAFNIEVVRTVAKVEFAFSNPSDDEIVVKNLEFSPISKGTHISIVPANEAIGFGPNNKLVTDILNNEPPKGGMGTLKFPELNKSLTPTNGKDVLEFYCKESLPKKDGGPFTIKLTNTRTGVEETKTLYTSKITYINRNDWIHIPIKFNDWIVIWRLHTYPPIGGYPAVFSQDGTGNNLTATVTTGGEFELYPVQIKRNNQEADFSDAVDWDNNMTVQVLDGSDPLFVEGKSPTVVTNPGNSGTHPITSTTFPKIVMGEFDPQKVGTAKVKITFYLKDTEYTNTKFECTFHITRQNKGI